MKKSTRKDLVSRKQFPTTIDVNYLDALNNLADELQRNLSSLTDEMAELILSKYGKTIPEKAKKPRRKRTT